MRASVVSRRAAGNGRGAGGVEPLDEEGGPLGAQLRSVLVVDDTRVMLEMLLELLRGSYSARGVATADEAYTAVAEEQFDVVIADYGVFGRDGLERLADTTDANVLVVSGNPDVRQEVEPYADGFATKGDDLDALTALIDELADG